MKTISDEIIETIYQQWTNSVPVSELSKTYGLHRDTIYKYIRMAKKAAAVIPTLPVDAYGWKSWLAKLSNAQLSDMSDAVDREIDRRNEHAE